LLVDTAFQQFGRLDVLVNSPAYQSHYVRVDEFSTENSTGPSIQRLRYRAPRRFLQALRRRRSGNGNIFGAARSVFGGCVHALTRAAWRCQTAARGASRQRRANPGSR
jgi:hypothetical protein